MDTLLSIITEEKLEGNTNQQNTEKSTTSEISVNDKTDEKVTSAEEKTTTTVIVTETLTTNISDEIVLRRDPTGRRNLINKSAYAKLHRAVSPEKNRIYVDAIKGRYERKSETDDAKLDGEYSPTTFGIPVHNHVSPKLPVAKPRKSVKSQIIIQSKENTDKNKQRYSLQIDNKAGFKDENSNEITNTSSCSEESITIVIRSESEESIDKFGKELDLFTMDNKPKEKKRSNSFRKIFSGKIFGKDKKKKDQEELPKMTYRENVSNNVNMQKETNSFNRRAAYRHTTGSLGNIPRETKVVRHSDQLMRGDPYQIKELENRYARMHVQEFNHIKQNFENQRPQPPPVDYTSTEKPLVNTPGPTNFAKYIDTSSSTSTAESDGNNHYTNEMLTNSTRRRDSRGPLIVAYRDRSRDRSRERSRERNTPPRAQDVRQDVRLVNPKALIPINSERALPNPYQHSNNSTLEKPQKINTNANVTYTLKQNEKNSPYFEETYGIVFDNIEKKHQQQQNNSLEKCESVNSIKEIKIPKSPTKIKLPPNREIVPLSPRVTSPIPQDNVSTDKVIATELLKPRSPSPTKRSSNSRAMSSSHQKLDIGIDYPDNLSNEQNERNIVTSKPPISKGPIPRNTESWSPSRQRISQYSPAFDKRSSQSSPAFENRENNNAKHRLSQVSPNISQEKVTTNVVIHTNSNTRTPTPNSIPQNRSMSPMRVTPVDMRPPSVSSLSPQKDDIRRSVAAFYWREIKKLKEQENMDLYYYQMNMMPSSYAEEPISTRRSRSMSPSSQRNSRRSLSLPRDPKPTSMSQDTTDSYGRIQRHIIPEGRAVMNQMNMPYEHNYQQNFQRNDPERRTLDPSSKINGNFNSNSLYRPIFKRGSLTTPAKEVDDQQNKKVSFSNGQQTQQNMQGWQARNGFAQHPSQQRNRNPSYDDDVFYPPNQQQNISREIYGYANRPMNPNMYQPQQMLPQNYNMLPPTYQNVNYQRHNLPQESPYGMTVNQNMRFRSSQHQQEELYGQPRDAVRPTYALTRHGSMQLPERPQILRKMSYDNNQMIRQPRPQLFQGQPIPMPRREIIVQDEIFGQFGGYVQQNEDPYGYSQRPAAESMYGYSQQAKQVSVNNRVCDMYGQIHDRSSPSLAKNSGVLLGQIRNSPQVTRHLSYENFQRNSRLTASVNDMYRRYPRIDPRYGSDLILQQSTRIQHRQQPQIIQQKQQESIPPSRPLPPVPDKKDNYGFKSDESITSNVQKSSSNSGKRKKRFFFGK